MVYNAEEKYGKESVAQGYVQIIFFHIQYFFLIPVVALIFFIIIARTYNLVRGLMSNLKSHNLKFIPWRL